MERRQFITTTLMAMSVMALPLPMLGQPGVTQPFVVKAGRSRINRPMKYRGVHPNDVIVSRHDTGDALSVFAYTGYDKIGPTLHLHIHQDELFVVQEGQYRFVVGPDTHLLTSGDLIFMPRNIPHSWIQVSDVGRMIYAVQPAGTMEDFFIEMDQLNRPMTREESTAIHHKHGMQVVGPPLKL